MGSRLDDGSSCSSVSRSLSTSGSALNLGLDLSWKSCECFFDIDSIFSWSFQEFDSKRVSESFSFLSFHLSASLEIGFIAHQEFDNILISVLVDLSQPVLNVLEGLSVGDIVDEDDSVSTLVVRGSDGLEVFLSCGVPYLKLNGASSGLEGSNLEINSNRWKEAT